MRKVGERHAEADGAFLAALLAPSLARTDLRAREMLEARQTPQVGVLMHTNIPAMECKNNRSRDLQADVRVTCAASPIEQTPDSEREIWTRYREIDPDA